MGKKGKKDSVEKIFLTKEELRKLHWFAKSVARYVFFIIADAPSEIIEKEKELLIKHREKLSHYEDTIAWEITLIKNLVLMLKESARFVREYVNQYGYTACIDTILGTLKKLNFTLNPQAELIIKDVVMEIIGEQNLNITQ